MAENNYVGWAGDLFRCGETQEKTPEWWIGWHFYREKEKT
jgi:hypothetical protein